MGDRSSRKDRRGAAAVLIAGPTASGKSALALRLARERGGMIINADSMQVYSELRVLTARPTPAEEAEVPHRLYGRVPAARRYSVGAWLEDAAAALAEAEAAGRVPVFVGGTGLYFKALVEGIALVPEIPAEIRNAIAEEAAAASAGAMHRRLAAIDPEGAALVRPSDPTRIARALEVLQATGRPLREWQSEGGGPLVDLAAAEAMVVEPDRTELHRRIEARVDRMLEEGALAEVERLAALKLDPRQPAMKAIGVRPLLDHLAGRMDLATAAERIKAETRRYAKRQLTWFRHQTPGWVRVKP